MAERRADTRLKTIDGGHVLHVDHPTGFANAVKEFLQEL
jgi:pimeloyl-ACP methyl ester carboxylesterase